MAMIGSNPKPSHQRGSLFTFDLLWGCIVWYDSCFTC